MTRYREQKLWDAMREGLSDGGLGARIRLERVENGAGEGMPDVLAVCNGLVTWCELKAVAALPARPTTRILGTRGLNQAQRNWHAEWHRAGGRSVVVVGIGSGRERAHFALPGHLGDQANDMTWRDFTRHNVARGAGAEFWKVLSAYLRGHI